MSSLPKAPAHAATPLGGRWLIRRKHSPEARLRLFCFPYAGGNAQIYHDWCELLPATIEVIAIEAPGKGCRLMETPCRSLDALCDGVMAAMATLQPSLPFAFFGHSNGAVIAFELARRMGEQGLPLPEQLLLSASPAPWFERTAQPYSAMSDSEFKAALRNFNATPDRFLDDDSIFNLLLPGLRADFSLAEGYHYRGLQPLPVSTHVYYGEFDEVTEPQLRAWQAHIQSPLSYEAIPGGHFFIHSHVHELTARIQTRLLSAAMGQTQQRLEQYA